MRKSIIISEQGCVVDRSFYNKFNIDGYRSILYVAIRNKLVLFFDRNGVSVYRFTSIKVD